MTELVLTGHAVIRMAQRSIASADSDLIVLIGTEVEDGYLVRSCDCQNAERVLKQIMQRVWRLEGKRLVVSEGRVVTAYHASKKHSSRILRRAAERGLID